MFTIYSATFDKADFCIETNYTVELPGNVICKHKDFFRTRPIGDWTSLQFKNGLSYADFLNVMVEKNTDIYRKMARLELDSVRHRIPPTDTKTYIKVMNAIRILDPTFVPPRINSKCGWQKELLQEVCNATSFRIISCCRNCYRLQHYFNVLKTL